MYIYNRYVYIYMYLYNIYIYMFKNSDLIFKKRIIGRYKNLNCFLSHYKSK